MSNISGRKAAIGVVHHTLSYRTSSKSTLLITNDVSDWLNHIQATSGTVTVFSKHTSSSLTIQENADPAVQVDLLEFLSDIAPEDRAYHHSTEGPDDMPAHIKTMLTSVSLTIPVQNSQMLLGTWQGIFLLEHRAHPHTRLIHLTFTGEYRS